MSKRQIVGTFLIGTGIAVGVFTGNWLLGASIAGIGYGMLTQPRVDLAERQGDILEMRVGAYEPLPVIYGTTRISGALVEVRVDDNSTAKRRLVIALAWCHGSRDGGDIVAIDEVWFEDRKAIDGSTVQSPFSSIAEGATKHLEFGHHLGSVTQAVDSRLNVLFPTQWPSTAQGRGVAYSRLELWFNGDIYPGGIPTVLAKIRGNRVYDPRDATWKHSDNPALCIRDYLLSTIYGLGVPETNLDEQSFIDMANYCDELVDDPRTSGGTMKRFTLNGWVDTSRSVVANLAELGTSCRGQVINEGDRWRLVIRRQRPMSGFKVDESNTLEGSWSYVLPGAESSPNVVRAAYVDPGKNYEVDTVQWPEPGDPNAFLTDDANVEQRLEIDLPFTDDRVRAQQIALTTLKELREGISAICTLKESALQIHVGDLVEVTQPSPGWVDKPFDVVALSLEQNGSVRAVLVEYEPTVYDLDVQDAPPAIPNTNLPNPFATAAPTGLVLTAGDAESITTADGVKIARIKMTWTAAVDPFLDHYEIQAKKTADATWDSFGTAPGTDTLFFVGPVTSVSWDVRIRAINRIGVASSWVTASITPNPTGSFIQVTIWAFGAVGSPSSGLPQYRWGIDGSSPAHGILDATDGVTVRTFINADWGGNDLTLMPVGGAAIVGTDPGGSALLRVGGAARFNAKIEIDGTDTPAAAGEQSISENVGNLELTTRGTFFVWAGNQDLTGKGLVVQSRTAKTTHFQALDPGFASVQRRLQIGQMTDQTDRIVQLVAAAGNTTGVNQYGIVLSSGIVFDSTATSSITGLYVHFQTQNAVFTTPLVDMVRILNPTKGASHTITTLVGLEIDAITAGGTNYAIRTSTGIVRFGDGVGIGVDATANEVFRTNRTYSGATGGEQFGILSVTNYAIADTGLKQGIRSGVAATHVSGTLADLQAGLFLAQAAGSGGTVTDLRGLYVRADTSAGATATSAYGIDIRSPLSSGTITTLYGLRIRTQTVGGTNYAIYTDAGLVRLGDDLIINSLGRFDSTDAPVDKQFLIYNAGVSKWQAETIQFLFSAGDTTVALLTDSTSVAFLYFDPGAGADSPVGAPPAPVLKLFANHKGITVEILASTAPDVLYHDGPSFPADFRNFVVEYSTDNFVADTKTLGTMSSDKAVHGRLTVGTTYYYRARAVDRAGNASANSATVSAAAAANSRVSAFGSLIATEIAVDRLAAISADVGVITAGQLRNGGNTAGVNLGGAGGIPSGWVSVINFESTSIPSGAKMILDFNAKVIQIKDEQASPIVRVEMGELDVGTSDWGLHLRGAAGNLIFDMHGSHFLLQNDAASPTQGVLIAGTLPSTWKRYLDLVDGLLHIKDDQASPVTRVKAGKVGAGAQDYGLQVFDKDAAAVMDFTGAKRILAVPVQPSADSGASITLDLSTGLTQQIRLTNSAAVVRMQNPVNGSRYRIWFQQDATGSRPFPAVVLDSDGQELVMYSNDTGTGPTPTRPTLTTEPGALDLFEFEYRTNPTGRFSCMPLQTAVRVPCPLVLSITATSVATPSTTHNISMPATVDAGDLLLMLFARSGTSAITTPTGWSLIASQGKLAIFAKDAVGTEDGTTVNVATASTESAAAQVYRITRWGGTVPTHVEASFNNGTSAFPDPPQRSSSWSVDRSLWIALFGSDGGMTSTYPTNYTNGTETTSGSGDVTLGSARRARYTVTEDPGTFELVASQVWDAATIVVKPAL